MGNTYNPVYIWCCKYGENRYSERCANKKLCASKHTGLLNSCLGKLCLHPYLVVPLISARVTLISTEFQPIVRPSYCLSLNNWVAIIWTNDEQALQWRHNGRGSVSNHQPHDCLLNRLFRRRSKKTSKLRVTGLCAGDSPVSPLNSSHKWPVTRKMFPFADVIMKYVAPGWERCKLDLPHSSASTYSPSGHMT